MANLFIQHCFTDIMTSDMSFEDIKLIFVDELRWEENTLNEALWSNIPPGWEDFFLEEKELLTKISRQLQAEKRHIWPELNLVFNAFMMTRPEDIKAVICGMDPYHTPGIAYGLSFSSKPGGAIPPSLRVVYKKLRQEGFRPSNDGYLGKWASKGVFLINAALTVAEKTPDSHMGIWRPFIEKLMKKLSNNSKIVWILWGQKALVFSRHAMNLVTGPHPSPLNVNGGFLDRNYFGECNRILRLENIDPIDWNLTSEENSLHSC